MDCVSSELCPLAYAIEGESEALGQLGQDEPASGMALEPWVAFASVSGSVAIALHHRNSDVGPAGARATHDHVHGSRVFC